MCRRLPGRLQMVLFAGIWSAIYHPNSIPIRRRRTKNLTLFLSLTIKSPYFITPIVAAAKVPSFIWLAQVRYAKTAAKVCRQIMLISLEETPRDCINSKKQLVSAIYEMLSNDIFFHRFMLIRLVLKSCVEFSLILQRT